MLPFKEIGQNNYLIFLLQQFPIKIIAVIGIEMNYKGQSHGSKKHWKI